MITLTFEFPFNEETKRNLQALLKASDLALVEVPGTAIPVPNSSGWIAVDQKTKPGQNWTAEEHNCLVRLVQEYGQNWDAVSQRMQSKGYGRNSAACQARFYHNVTVREK